uniref:2-hydroxyacyl-CoA lyase 2 n=1 Tax=Panagrolaimus sp. JU765 TaxID=591449 RepID=A0AC34R198_9BILA
MIYLILATTFISVFVAAFFDIDSFGKLLNIIKSLLQNDRHPFTAIFQVDETTKRNGGDIVADVLHAHNVKEIFTLVGGHISPILVAAERLGIKVIDTRHEVTAVFAADAVARLRQSIGVAAVTAGPGLTNTITAVKNAQMAESPLLLIGGAAPTLLKDRGALQDIDQIVLFRPLCKFVARVTKLRDIIPTVRKAINIAQSGTPGPVFIEFPIDVLFPYQTVVAEAGLVKNPQGFQKILNLYLFYHISRQFGSAHLPTDMLPIPVKAPLPKHDDIEKLADIISKSERPLILLGSQATLPPVQPMELQKTINKLGIPAYLGGMCRGLLGKSSNLQMRQNRREALRDADVVILAGTVCDFRLGYGKVLSRKSKVISINRDYTQLTKNKGIFWNATQLIQADVATSLVQLSKSLELRNWKGAPNTWIDELRKRENEKEESNLKKINEKTADGNLNPLSVLQKLDNVLPDDAILVADGGDFVGSAAYIVRPRGPLQWLDPGAFGTLGVGGGFALGAKCVHPDRPVIIIYGDGSSGYSIMEFDTYLRHNKSVIAVIGNDACWSQIARDQVPWFNSSVACDLAYTRYDKIGEAIGVNGLLMDTKNESDIVDNFDKAIKESREGKSAVINVVIGKTDFRKGSISV